MYILRNHRRRSNRRQNLIALAVLASATIAAAMVSPHAAYAQSQLALNEQAAKEFKAADARLNVVYSKLMARLDKTSQVKLKAAQRSWIAFRDAEADFHADAMARGGSLAPLEYSQIETDLTRTRTRDLEKMLKDLAL